jgi:dienelactone hydrolase
MINPEPFEISLQGGVIRGSVHRTELRAGGSLMPAIIIVRGVHVSHDDHGGFVDELTAALRDRGFMVVRFEHRCAELILDDFHAHSLSNDLDDIHAVHTWLMSQDGVDGQHVGMIGYSLGAIAVCALAASSQWVERLCLISPASADDLVNRLTRTNGKPAPIDPQHLPAAYLPSLSDRNSPADLTQGERPTLIVHGASDQFIDPHISFEYLQAMQECGRSIEHVLIARADHAYTAPDTRRLCLDAVAGFYTRAFKRQTAAALA